MEGTIPGTGIGISGTNETLESNEILKTGLSTADKDNGAATTTSLDPTQKNRRRRRKRHCCCYENCSFCSSDHNCISIIPCTKYLTLKMGTRDTNDVNGPLSTSNTTSRDNADPTNNNNTQNTSSNSNNSHHRHDGIGSTTNIFQEVWTSSEMLFSTQLNWLLLLGPVALMGDATGFLGEAACFAFSGIALIPCAER